MARCVVIGTTNSAIYMAHGVLDSGEELVAMVSLKKDLLPNNSVDIETFAKSVGVDYYEVDDINKYRELFASFDMDYLIVSWPKIIREHIYSIPKIASICAHATDLPKNRGRHAAHWYKVLGMKEGVLSFFTLDDGVDTGDVVLKLPFRILDNDNVNDINQKIEQLSKEGVEKILRNPSLIDNKSVQVGVPNYWRKRNMYDVLIDVRMPRDYIIALVDSFCPPYPCAKLIFESKIFNIVSAKKINKECENIEYGKVFFVDNNSIVIKCGDGAIELTSDESFRDFILDNFSCKVVGVGSSILDTESLDSNGDGAIYLQTPAYYMAKHNVIF